MRIRKTMSNWLTTRYQMVVRNEENLAEVSSVNFTYAKVIVISLLIFILFFIGGLFLAQTALSQWFDPRHTTMEYNRKLLKLTVEMDSLKWKLRSQNKFIDNFQNVLKGDVPTGTVYREPDNLGSDDFNRDMNPGKISEGDSIIREEFEQIEVSLTSYSRNNYSEELKDIFFFTPLQGIVSSPYDLSIDHYGVDIVAKNNEPVKSIADGTVILSSWTQEGGYVIAVQHRANLISVIRHNSALLKKVGNFVNAGEVISIIGNTGELTTGPHVHLELWYNGNPVDPEEFITF
ncbi:M23 family metallopeptidase [Marivirga sp. S37H4]|uniref:M23 family metallopeptidase n=1 Tax=Marivirga aurantiaca TaxID=2802615 RepID=A0A934WZU1_9BACT|nr:M23 family metallopeptidase [Marivirga aurantiaca]MBK6265845.1 M23 family metallopeptidase [Marivirga aurantiaca]